MYPRGSLLVMYRPFVTWWFGVVYGRKRCPALGVLVSVEDMGSCRPRAESASAGAGGRCGARTSNSPEDMVAARLETNVMARLRVAVASD